MDKATPTQVRSIIDTSLQDAEIQEYVDSADVFLPAVFASVELSTAVQLEMSKWCSAHFIAMTKDRQAESEKSGSASIKYTGKTDMGFEATTYGQMLLRLDQTGLLQKAQRKQASINVVTSFK